MVFFLVQPEIDQIAPSQTNQGQDHIDIRIDALMQKVLCAVFFTHDFHLYLHVYIQGGPEITERSIQSIFRALL